jgi:cell wall-associated NlpC family hydrolase
MTLPRPTDPHHVAVVRFALRVRFARRARFSGRVLFSQRAHCALGALLALGALTGCVSSRLAAPAPAPSSAVPLRQTPSAPGPASPTSEQLVDAARAMLGQPYRWGGAEPGGFDCSGLVQYAARAAGIAVPRTSEEQLRAGIAVPKAALASGDLVFLHLAGKELHVGIALDGGRFIHAPSHGGRVRIDSLAAPPYARGFFAARRITPPPP